MESWVFIFSRFTQEALLFEALLIFIGFAAYAAFYITRRRKYGVAGQEIPSNLVKVYLAQLVADAEEMRIQLFGLLGKGEATGKLFNINVVHTAEAVEAARNAGAPAGASAADVKWSASDATSPSAAAALASDPQAAQKLRDLEARMAEQAKALEAVMNEKMRLEEELAVAKTRSPGSESAGEGGDEEMSERVKTLEAQLAEYAVIEDDLANLKRLQKENKTLRSQIEQLQTVAETAKEKAPAAAATTPEASAPKAAEATTVPGVTGQLGGSEEQKISGSLEPSAQTETRIEAGAPEAAAETRVPAGAPAPSDPTFEALVDDVEKSLKETAPAQAAAPTAETQAPLEEKSEEELQADFEKMLKS